MIGLTSTRMAGRWARSVASGVSGVRRRSDNRPRRMSTSYSALLPRGPFRYVDVRKSRSGVRGCRFAAQMLIAMATARSSAVPISSRYDILPSRQLLRRFAERFVLAGIARHRPEQMAVQLRDETGERCAPPIGQPRFPDILDRKSTRLNS